jgi:hypothetical protein
MAETDFLTVGTFGGTPMAPKASQLPWPVFAIVCKPEVIGKSSHQALFQQLVRPRRQMVK